MKKLVILSGAGMSAESGINTFRDAGGLWEGHNVLDVASPMGWKKNRELVLDFYNKRRRQLRDVIPNAGHIAVAELERKYDVHVITQNVDDLHERAGSSKVLHLHGELVKVRSTADENFILDWNADLNVGDVDPNGNQLRPHIVWFGEMVPALEEAVEITMTADILVIIGTSLQVYPAASLIDYAKLGTPIFYIDPNPAPIYNLQNHVEVIAERVSVGMQILADKLSRIV